MNVITVLTGKLYENCYIIVNGSDAVIIDPGTDFDKIDGKLLQHNIANVAILLTHGHCDHCNACAELKNKYSAKIYISSIDYEMIKNGFSLAQDIGQQFNDFIPDEFISDGQTIRLFGMDFFACKTSGHTAGSFCYLIEDCLFTGDTLFYLSVGRSDFPTGNYQDLISSVQKLFSINKDLTVYPGHGRPTKLNYEKENNPYA